MVRLDLPKTLSQVLHLRSDDTRLCQRSLSSIELKSDHNICGYAVLSLKLLPALFKASQLDSIHRSPTHPGQD